MRSTATLLVVCHFPLLKLTIEDPFGNIENDNYRTLPFAYIAKSGPKSDYKEGSFVRLLDYKCLSVKNPLFEGFKKNPMKNSNMEVVSNPHNEWRHEIHRFFSKHLFVIDPLKEKLDVRDYFTFMLDPSSEVVYSMTDVTPYL